MQILSIDDSINPYVSYNHIVSIMAKLLTVFGATGQQGGALIDYVLRNSQLSGSFSLRGVTRDATKPASIALKNRGVEIIEVSYSSSGC